MHTIYRNSNPFGLCYENFAHANVAVYRKQYEHVYDFDQSAATYHEYCNHKRLHCVRYASILTLTIHQKYLVANVRCYYGKVL